MIVQQIAAGAAPDTPRFCIKNTQHTALAGALAAAYGNEQFPQMSPTEDMLYLVAHHDDGWEAVDRSPGIDPETGLPWHLISTPLEIILQTSSASPDINGAKGPLNELLSSMHIYGLYTGRYGMSDKVTLDAIPETARPAVQRMLDGELVRQERLRAQLADDPRASEQAIMHNYKLLQFFDTLALYFNMQADGDRGTTTFTHVPTASGEDVNVQVQETSPGVCAFSPFPFAEDGVTVSCEGRYMKPGQDTNFSDIPVATQHYRLVAA